MSINEDRLTFWEHLEELLTRLRTVFYAIIISITIIMVFPVGFDSDGFSLQELWYTTFASLAIGKLREDFLPPGVELIPISWDAPLQVYVYVSLILSATASSPVIAYELHKFINPALYEQERKAIMPFVLSFTALFVFGFLLGYFLVMPATVRLLLMSAETLGLSPKYAFAQFFSLVAGGLLVCGFVMTCPVYLVLLVKSGLLDTEQFKKNRRYIYGAILIAISILDPDPTLITESFLGIPTILILEAALRVARRFEKSDHEAPAQKIS